MKSFLFFHHSVHFSLSIHIVFLHVKFNSPEYVNGALCSFIACLRLPVFFLSTSSSCDYVFLMYNRAGLVPTVLQGHSARTFPPNFFPSHNPLRREWRRRRLPRHQSPKLKACLMCHACHA